MGAGWRRWWWPEGERFRKETSVAPPMSNADHDPMMPLAIQIRCRKCGSTEFEIHLEDTGGRVPTVWAGRPPGTTDRWVLLQAECVGCWLEQNIGGIGIPDSSAWAKKIDVERERLTRGGQ